MANSSVVTSVVLDHDYCAPPKAKEAAVNNDKLDEPLPSFTALLRETQPSGPVSSLSPAHSSDSGLDNGIDALLADLGVQDEDIFDFDDFESLFKVHDTSNDENQTAGKQTSGSLQGVKSKVLNPSSKTNVESKTKTDTNDTESDFDELVERNKKNAIAARENRLKRKKYVEGLEGEVSKLREENKILKKETGDMKEKFEKLEEEAIYLKNVLANESTISLLLKSIAATPGISLSSSLVPPSRVQEAEDEDKQKRYSTRSRKRAADESLDTCKRKRSGDGGSGGVCLHVNQEKVSLELCSKCSSRANGWK